MSATTLTRPSPSTKPLAVTISVMPSSIPLDCRRVLHITSIAPPISLANVNDGVFKKPIANATPEGMYFVTFDCPCAQYTFTPETRPKMIAKTNMKKPLFSGRFPSPTPQSECESSWIISGDPHEVIERDLARYMLWVLGMKGRVSRMLWCKFCTRSWSQR